MTGSQLHQMIELAGRTHKDILSDINGRMRDRFPDEETMSYCWWNDEAHTWPSSGCWRALVYVVEGTNEGHYIHLAVLTDPNDSRAHGHCETTVVLLKTFGGFDVAWEIAKQIAFWVCA